MRLEVLNEDRLEQFKIDIKAAFRFGLLKEWGQMRKFFQKKI